MAISTVHGNRTFSMSNEEASFLLGLLQEAYREKQVEVHRTEALTYRESIQREETLLRGLVERLREMVNRSAV